jgi:very-short-patch-repair endonuclease
MPAMVRSPHFFRLAGSAGQSPTTIEGNWSVDEEFRLAEGQYGLMTRSQLRERGLTDRQIQYRLTTGRLELIFPNVYRVVGAPKSVRQRAMGATLWLGRETAVSHTTSAVLLHLDGIRTEELHMTVPATNRSRTTRFHVLLHRVVSLPPHDIRFVDGIACTAAPRTLLDIACDLDDEALETAVESARRMGLTTMNALRRALRELEGRPGAARLRTVLHALEQRPSESKLEVRLVRLLRAAKFPRSVPQYPIGEYRVDRAWPERAYIVEAEGFQHHGRRLIWKRDRRRVAEIEARGWRITNVTWDDVTQRPAQTLDRIALALGKLAA